MKLLETALSRQMESDRRQIVLASDLERVEGKLDQLEGKLDQLITMLSRGGVPLAAAPAAAAPAAAAPAAAAPAAAASSAASSPVPGSSSQLSPGRLGNRAARNRRNSAIAAGAAASVDSDGGDPNAFSSMMTGQGQELSSTLKDKSVTQFFFECATMHSMKLPPMRNARHKSQAKKLYASMMAMLTDDEKEDLLPASSSSGPDRRRIIRRAETLLLKRLGAFYKQGGATIPRPIVQTAEKEASASLIATALSTIARFRPKIVVDLGDFVSWRKKWEAAEEEREEEEEEEEEVEEEEEEVEEDSSSGEAVLPKRRRRRSAEGGGSPPTKKRMSKVERLRRMAIDGKSRRIDRSLRLARAKGILGAAVRAGGVGTVVPRSMDPGMESSEEEEFEGL